jgi:hypothetical protein
MGIVGVLKRRFKVAKIQRNKVLETNFAEIRQENTKLHEDLNFSVKLCVFTLCISVE